jgi:hypothetical protein
MCATDFIQQISHTGQWRIASQDHAVGSQERLPGVGSSEKKLVGGRAPNQRSAPTVEKREASGIQGQSMYQDSSIIQRQHPVELENLVSVLRVTAFGQVQDEWLTLRSGGKLRR